MEKDERRKAVYTKRTFCEAYEVSPATFYRWTKLPGFPVVRCGRKLLIPAEAADNWFNNQIGKNVLPEGVNHGKTV